MLEFDGGDSLGVVGLEARVAFLGVGDCDRVMLHSSWKSRRRLYLRILQDGGCILAWQLEGIAARPCWFCLSHAWICKACDFRC